MLSEIHWPVLRSQMFSDVQRCAAGYHNRNSTPVTNTKLSETRHCRGTRTPFLSCQLYKSTCISIFFQVLKEIFAICIYTLSRWQDLFQGHLLFEHFPSWWFKVAILNIDLLFLRKSHFYNDRLLLGTH